MASGTVRVKGLREFQRAIARADPELKKQVRGAFREVGLIVQRDAAVRFSTIDAGSAAGFRPVVRQRGVTVEQTRRKVTGKRPDYGALQMRRGLVPALEANEDKVVRALEDAIDKVADIVEG